jgi:hypothetical protein
MAIVPGEPLEAEADKPRIAFRVSERLVLFSVALQALDILIMILAVRRGFFAVGRGPLMHLTGLQPAVVWLIMKTSAFLVLILSAMKGRRLLIVLLNVWFLVFDAFNLAMMYLS